MTDDTIETGNVTRIESAKPKVTEIGSEKVDIGKEKPSLPDRVRTVIERAKNFLQRGDARGGIVSIAEDVMPTDKRQSLEEKLDGNETETPSHPKAVITKDTAFTTPEESFLPIGSSNFPRVIELTRTEKSFPTEEARQILKTFIEPYEELEKAGLLKGLRVVFFGSSVYASRAPTDLDVLVIYDSYDKNWLDRLKSNKVSLSKNASYKLVELHMSRNVSMDFVDRLDTRYDIHDVSPEGQGLNNFKYVDYALLSTKELRYVLGCDEATTKRDAMQGIVNLANFKEIPEDVKPFFRSFKEFVSDPYRQAGEISLLMESHAAQIPDDLKLRIRNFLDRNIDSLDEKEKEYVKKELVKNIVDLLKNLLPAKYSKNLGSNFQTLYYGRNYIQSAVDQGAFLIKGENIRLGLSRKNFFKRVDSDFLK